MTESFPRGLAVGVEDASVGRKRHVILRGVELDQVGAVASFACAVHCAAIPIALSVSAGGAVSLLDNRPVEWGLVLLSAAVGTTSAWRGYRRHGNKAVAVVLAAAALGLVLATTMRRGPDPSDPERLLAFMTHRPRGWSPRLVPWLFPVIGCTIAVAHLVNLRLCRTCRGCDASECAPASPRRDSAAPKEA